MRRSYGDRTTTNLVALEMLEQGSSSPAPRPAPQSTASSFEEENEENRPPPTLLQRRKMDPLSPIAFNFGAPHCRAIGKTYIKIRPRLLSPLKKSVDSNNNPARGTPALAGKQRATPMSAKLASIRKMQQRSSSSRRGGTPQRAPSIPFYPFVYRTLETLGRTAASSSFFASSDGKARVLAVGAAVTLGCFSTTGADPSMLPVASKSYSVDRACMRRIYGDRTTTKLRNKQISDLYEN